MPEGRSYLEDLCQNAIADSSVSVILPTYNERETVIDVVESVLRNLEMVGYDPEVIVVDDGSPDGTADIVRAHFGADERVDVIERLDEQGLSSAVLDGLRIAEGRFAVVMDADGQHPPEKIPELLLPLGHGHDGPRTLGMTLSGQVVGCRSPADDAPDTCVGSRHVLGGSIEGWTLHRRVMSRAASWIARYGVPAARNLRDPMSGFFALDMDIFDDEVLEHCDPHGYKVLLELLTHADDPTVAEIPITFQERQGGSSKMTLDEQLRFLEHVATLRVVSSRRADQLVAPQLIRALELGGVVGLSLLVLFVGLWLGGVDGYLGAALIAAAGGGITLGVLRYQRTQERWEDTDERYAKG